MDTKMSVMNTTVNILDNGHGVGGNDADSLAKRDPTDTAMTPQKAIIITIMTTSNVFMLFGNGFSIYIILRSQTLRRHTYYWLVLNLAVLDLMNSMFVVPINIVWEFYGNWPFSQLLCDLEIFCDLGFSTVAAYSTVLLSLDKYLYINKPFFYHSYVGPKSTVACILGNWAIWMAYSAASVFGGMARSTKEYKYTTFPLDNCNFVLRHVYAITSFFLVFFIPLVILVFTSSRILCVARQHIRKIHSNQRVSQSVTAFATSINPKAFLNVSLTTPAPNTASSSLPSDKAPTSVEGKPNNDPSLDVPTLATTASVHQTHASQEHTNTGQHHTKSEAKPNCDIKYDGEDSDSQSLSLDLKKTHEQKVIIPSIRITTAPEDPNDPLMHHSTVDDTTDSRDVAAVHNFSTMAGNYSMKENGKTKQNSISLTKMTHTMQLSGASKNNSDIQNQLKMCVPHSEKKKQQTDKGSHFPVNNGATASDHSVISASALPPTQKAASNSLILTTQSPRPLTWSASIAVTTDSEESNSKVGKNKQRKPSAHKSSNSHTFRAFGTVILVVVVFIIMFAPYWIASVINLGCLCIPPMAFEDYLAVFYYMHSLANPYIYVATDRRYKRVIRNMLTRSRCWHKVTRRLSRATPPSNHISESNN